jgi:hypothetical protein
MKNLTSMLLGTLIVGAVAIPAAAAQPLAQFGDPDQPDNGVLLIAMASQEVYLVASGGVGDEERARMESQAARYSVRMTFSEQNGQYVVADTVSVTKKGDEVMRLHDVGPLVYAQMPPGQYAFQATYKGVTQTRVMNVTGRVSDLHMTWPTSLD